MRVFLAGASGAIGRPLVARLAAAGHEVVCLARSRPVAGAATVTADVYDPDALARAVAEARPGALLHELTALPGRLNVHRLREDFAPTMRLRTEGTRNLVAAARAAGVERFLFQSISFGVPPGAEPADESVALWESATGALGEMIRAAADGERQALAMPEGIVLRYGTFYGSGTYYAGSDGSIADDVRAGRRPIVGEGGSVTSFIHVDDAAAATVAALERGKPGIYNIVDGEPAPEREWLPHLARILGAPPPRQVGVASTQTPPSTNAKARRDLGWQPARRWREALGEG